MSCRLVQIEVQDFKSFGGKHIIGPFKDFTGIVGPNGSGKSNVLDSLAFAFYLDKNPRSTDYINTVIGNERVDSASVKVTIEEEEGKKKKKKVIHTYERVIDREGNSELLIDDKEINEDKYKKTVLSKGFHPLIFVKQAEVDMVARKSPIELTQLFEEMSGSKEYAEQYDDLRIRSEAAHEAVSMIEKRRRAAISERRHISERKVEAASFREKAKQEEELQIESSLYQLYHMNEQLKIAEEDAAGFQQEIIQLGSNLDEATQNGKEIESKKLETTNKFITIDEEYKKVEQQMRDANATQIKAKVKETVFEERYQAAKTNLGLTAEAAKRHGKDLEKYKQEYEQISLKINELPAVDKTEKEIEEYKNFREQASKQFDDITQALRKALKDRTDEQRNLNDLVDQRETLESSKKRIQEKIIDTKNDQKKTEIKLSDVQKEISTNLADKKMSEQRNANDINSQSKKQKELHELEKKYEEIRRNEGSSRRKDRLKKAIATMQRIIPGVYGKFEDLCRPLRPKYTVAAEACCASYLEAIIVKDRESAVRCIDYLREQGAGTANFLPLQNLKPVKIHTKKAVLTLASIMTCDPLYKPALDYVCGHIAVTGTIDEAKKLSFGENIMVVAEDGTIVDPRGIMTGGTTKNKKSFSGSLDSIEEKKKNLEKELGQLGDMIEKRKGEIDLLEEKLLSLEPQKSHYKQRIDDLESRIKLYETEIRTTDRRIKEINEKIKRAENVLKEKEAEVEKVNFAQAKNDAIIFKEFCDKHHVKDVKEFEITRLQVFEERYKTRLEYQSRLTQLNSLISDEERALTSTTPENQESLVKELGEKLEETRKEYQQSNDEYIRYKEELEEIKEERKRILDEDQSNRQEMKAQHKIIKEISNELETIKDKLTAAEHEKQTASQIITSVLQQCRLANIKLPHKKGRSASASQDPEMQNTPSSLTQEYLSKNEVEKIDFKQLSTHLKVKAKQEDFKKQVKQYEENLDKIKAELLQIRPDLKSDDRYTEVEKELDKISTDQEELRQEATRIKKEFIEVKTKRRDLFMQLYDSVDQNIDKIYKKLTRVRNQENRSGTAYLALEDTEEPYLGGIKYTAMPPHKRFRDLDQLSGGEKAVASLALVIALQKNTDSPFIFMDEPDASLDKLNLRSAASALREISKTTQIISVSLRDKFFEHSDVLIGIYKDKNRQTSGVITLNLSEFMEQNLEMEALE